MGLLDRLKQLFTSKSDVKAMEHRVESMEHREESLVSEPTHSIQSLESPKAIKLSQISTGNMEEPIHMPEIERDSYQLGLATGYTGRSIKEIEASLTRIEGQMITKDWFEIKLQQIDRRIEDIERALGIIKGSAPAIEQQKIAILKRMPLTRRMEDVLKAIKEAGEISFADLALKMNMDVSDLRSLLSIMTKRTNAVERFHIHRVGWVKHIGEPIQSDSSASNQQINE